MPLSNRSNEGYLYVDHRNSPGIPGRFAEGSIFEAPTQRCAHCGTISIINPNRTRDREYCMSCNSYVCDNCGLERKLPGYQHKSLQQKFEEIVENNIKQELISNG